METGKQRKIEIIQAPVRAPQLQPVRVPDREREAVPAGAPQRR
jgi:hypothetical protein